MFYRNFVVFTSFTVDVKAPYGTEQSAEEEKSKVCFVRVASKLYGVSRTEPTHRTCLDCFFYSEFGKF